MADETKEGDSARERLRREAARLDADRTARPRTVLTSLPVSGSAQPRGDGATVWAGPASWLLDTETGERIYLGEGEDPLGGGAKP